MNGDRRERSNGNKTLSAIWELAGISYQPRSDALSNFQRGAHESGLSSPPHLELVGSPD